MGALLAVLYLVFSALCAYDAFLEYEFSSGHQPERIPYLIVMYSSLELLFTLSAFRTLQATTLLHRLLTQPTAHGLTETLSKVRDMLLLFFVWMSFIIIAYIGFAFQPIR
jgi:hypothetical protein